MYCCSFLDCNREFGRRADLLRHARSHLVESDRPHKCRTCGQRFLFPKDLRRHQKTHDGDGKSLVFYKVIYASLGLEAVALPAETIYSDI